MRDEFNTVAMNDASNLWSDLHHELFCDWAVHQIRFRNRPTPLNDNLVILAKSFQRTV